VLRNLRAVSEAPSTRRRFVFIAALALRIQRFEGSRRQVCDGRYGISIDFGLEVVGRTGTCETTIRSKVINLRRKTIAHGDLIVTPKQADFQDY
jgi:hypothetical protein